MDRVNFIKNSRFNINKYILILITCATSLHLADVSASPLDCFYEPTIGEFICRPDPNPNPTPEVDDFNIQFTYQFETRVGDINADGRKDIFIKRNTGPSSNGVINKIMLTGNADGSFSIYNAATWELNSAYDWPQKSIEVANNDFNLDGYFDVMLKDVSDHISGSKDHIIFSNQQANGLAAGVTQMDDQFYKFFSNAAMYTADGDYFANHSEIGYQLNYEYVWMCTWGQYPYYDFNCGYIIVPIYIPVIHYDEDVIDPRALLANLAMESGDYIGALERWRVALGAPAIESVINGTCLRTLSEENCSSMRLLTAVLNRLLSSGQDQQKSNSSGLVGELRTRVVRFSDVGSWFKGVDKAYHLSVHAPILGTDDLTTWNSGFPSNNGFLDGSATGTPGTLQSKYLAPTDATWETRVIRTIYHPAYDSNHPSYGLTNHFSFELNTASASFDDNMFPYCHWPESNQKLDLVADGKRVPCANDGKNSNSFAIGLVESVGGSLRMIAYPQSTFGGRPLPDLTVKSHPGINEPVPNSAF